MKGEAMAEALTYDELRIRLGEQIELLQLSAENFDKGYMATTLNMATAIRVLFHDTSSSISLIKQICEFDKVDKSFFEMISTKEAVPGNPILVLHGDGLYYMTLSNSGVTCIPKLNNANQTRISFNDWWHESVIKNVSRGAHEPVWMTREELIKLHANKEGGTHVDVKKDKRISDIGTKEAFGWKAFVTDVEGNSIEVTATVDQKKATLRQICYEVLVSLHNHFPELFKRDYY